MNRLVPYLPEAAIAIALTSKDVKPENPEGRSSGPPLAEEQTGKRQVVVVAREAMGRTRPFVVSRESEAVPLIHRDVASGSIIHADESCLGAPARFL